MEEISFEVFGQLLDEVVREMPEEIFVSLNGGINLLEEAMPHPEADEGQLYILGQYHYGGSLGRYITIYYGSFMELYGRRSQRQIRRQIDRVLRHEFLHHLESMAGEKGLEVQDAVELARFKARQGIQQPAQLSTQHNTEDEA